MLHWSLWLRSWVHLRGRTYLRSWTFLRSRPYRLNWPLLGFRSCRRCLLNRSCRPCLRDRPFLHGPLDGGLRLLALLHHRRRNRLAPFHGKRLGGYDRLRLAAVYGNKLGAVRARYNPLLPLNR